MVGAQAPDLRLSWVEISEDALASLIGDLLGPAIGIALSPVAVVGFILMLVPLAGLNKRQGRALLDHLGAPEHLVRKVPTADLLDDAPGQTDESSLGLSYDQIDDFLEGRDIEKAAASLLIEKNRATEHTRRTPEAPTDSWWIRH